MLHRSYSLLKFIQCNVTGCSREQFHILQIGIAKRHTSTYIKKKLIYVISNSSKLCHNYHVNPRWICSTTPKLDTVKVKDTIKNKNKKEKVLLNSDKAKVDFNAVHKGVELNEDNLGKLKERHLDVEPIATADNLKKDTVTLITKEKVKKEEKKVVLDEKIKKKGGLK